MFILADILHIAADIRRVVFFSILAFFCLFSVDSNTIEQLINKQLPNLVSTCLL